MFLLFMKGGDQRKNVLFYKIEGRKIFGKKKKWGPGYSLYAMPAYRKSLL
jgi:hypothetical protein